MHVWRERLPELERWNLWREGCLRGAVNFWGQRQAWGSLTGRIQTNNTTYSFLSRVPVTCQGFSLTTSNWKAENTGVFWCHPFRSPLRAVNRVGKRREWTSRNKWKLFGTRGAERSKWWVWGLCHITLRLVALSKSVLCVWGGARVREVRKPSDQKELVCRERARQDILDSSIS